jgi:hypothetical protein
VQFAADTLRLPGRVLGVSTEDLNGDGKRDLVAVVALGRPPSVTRKLAVFFDHGGHYNGEPDQLLDPPHGCGFVDLGDLDGDGKRALICGEGRQLVAWRMAGDRLETTPRPVMKAASLFAIAEDDELPFFDVLRDWDGDGRAEILLPQVDGIAVYTRGADGWSRAAILRTPSSASYMVRSELYEPRIANFSMRAAFVVPEMVTGDYDGDGKPDLFLVVEDTLAVHKGGGPTVFSAVPIARHFLGVRTPEEAVRGAHVATAVRDLDGDGVADLIVNKISGGLGQMKAQTAIYYGRKGGGYDPPSQLLQREGYSGAFSLADLDGDGKPELVMPHVDVGLTEMARALLAKKMLVGWEVRKNRGRKFSVDADVAKDIDLPVDTSRLADVDGPFPSVAGDFDGDGRADFVAAHGSDKLAIWLGDKKTLLKADPTALVHVTPSKYYQPVDLDGDKRADLVLFYRAKEQLASTVVVLRNTGRGW